MADDRRSSSPRPHVAPAVTAGTVLPATVLQGALTPRGLFANLFPLTFATGNLGTLRQTTKARKEEFGDRRRPRFYQSGDALYAYGSGLDEFKDSRFTAAIVAVESEPRFAQLLAKAGLMDLFRALGYVVRWHRGGISVIDHVEVIATAKAGFLHILPEYTFQTLRVEGAQGTPIYAVSIDVSWATVPAFEIGNRVQAHVGLLQNLKLTLTCRECGPHCPLHDRLNRVLGVFDAFAEADAALTSACACEDYTPQPVRVIQRSPQRRATRGKAEEASERMIVVPGQVVKPAPGQRRVLRLFHDRSDLELEGRIWLGDLTRSKTVRVGGLQVRYERMQHFLARIAGHATNGIAFALPTGTDVTLERLPVSGELLARA